MDTYEELGPALVIVGWMLCIVIGGAGTLYRAGLPVWRAFVPGLNAAEICRVAGLSPWWVLTIFLPGVNLAVGFYVALRLARRCGYSHRFGLLLALSLYGLLPILGFGRWGLADDQAGYADPSQSSGRGPQAKKRDASAAPGQPVKSAVSEREEQRLQMLVATIMYVLGLLCVPGLLVVVAMGFAGARPEQIAGLQVVVGAVALAPISLLIALIGGWVLYRRERYRAALGLGILPVLHLLVGFAGFLMAALATKS